MLDINKAEQMQIFLIVSPSGPWAPLLRRGVGILLEEPVSVREFMLTILGMDQDYATNSVPGLFLNNAPVDEWREEFVGGEDTVAMSGTMPGLCGIALRRASPIRVFRPDLISGQDCPRQGGMVTLKMFNFVARDCCLAVLSQGVCVAAGMLRDFLDHMNAWGDVSSWNGQTVCGEQVQALLTAQDANARVFLKTTLAAPTLPACL